MKSMFWGVALIIIGVLSLLNYTLGIQLPIFKVLIALALIYAGLSMLFGSFNLSVRGKRSTDKEAIFSSGTFRYPAAGQENSQHHQYVTVFGNSTLDLSNVDVSTNPNIEVTSVFGESRITLKKGTPVRMQTTTVLGRSQLPEKNTAAMGEFTYNSPGLKENDPALNLKTNVVFGSLLVDIQE